MAYVTLRDVPVKDRILLHLSNFTHVAPGQEYNVPFDLTQDGIARVTGITRSHASLDLKRLGDVGMVTSWQARQKGVRTRRLVYAITQPGLDKVDVIRKKLDEAGIDPSVILDMKRCDPEVKWNALSPRDRETFGRASVFRVPVPREIFPPTETGALPADISGCVLVPPDVAKVYLEKIPADEIAKWHGWAADWWMEQGNIQERLYHLICAGRNLEAVKYAVRHSDEFIFNPNEDLLNLLAHLQVPEDYAEDVYWLRSQVAYACGSLENVKACLKALEKYRSSLSTVVEAQLCMMHEDYGKAYGLAATAYDELKLPLAAVMMAQVCLLDGDYKQADKLAVAASDAMHEIGDAKDIDSILKIRAEIAYRNGNMDDTRMLLGKAMAAAPDYKKGSYKNLLRALDDPRSKIRFS